MILLFQTLASAFLSTLFFVPELLDYPKRNVCGQSQNNEQGKVGRSVLLINLRRDRIQSFVVCLWTLETFSVILI